MSHKDPKLRTAQKKQPKNAHLQRYCNLNGLEYKLVLLSVVLEQGNMGKYKRISNRKNVSEAVLMQAKQKQQGCQAPQKEAAEPIREISRQLSIPESTLRLRFKKVSDNKCSLHVVA